MRKDLSNMTDQQFIECVAALDMNYKQVATALRKHQSTISGYASGRNPIPREIVASLQLMIDAKIKQLDAIYHIGKASIGQMITIANEHKRPSVHQTEGRFMRRQDPPDTRTYPVYRMSPERFKTYAEALAVWNTEVHRLAHIYTDEIRQRDYKLEIADLKAMAASAPRQAPYDVCITRTEWDVVSRMLRHYAKQGKAEYRAAHALRAHWNRHKGAGFPINRKARHTALINSAV